MNNVEAEIQAFIEALLRRGMRGCYIAVVSVDGKTEGYCVATLPFAQAEIIVAAGDDLMRHMKLAA